MIKKGFFAFLIFITSWCNSQSDTLIDSDIQLSILTCAPGKDIYSIYGHNAIRVFDKQTGSDLVYNYGTFDFKTKGFIIKFMLGKLPYTLDVAEYERFLMEYNYFQRSVTEQILDLDPTQKEKTIAYLAINMLPENRTYKYDFFMDNCATRLRDIIDKNIADNQWDTGKSSAKTFRQIIKEYQANMPWLDFGIDLIIGAPADKVTTLSQETFIPDYLAQAIKNANLRNSIQRPLMLNESKILTFENKSNTPGFLLSPHFLFFILLLLEINLFFRHLQGKVYTWIANYDNIWFILITLSSLLMLFMWFCTDHIPTKYNWNILWASPLIPIFWWLKGKNKVLMYLLTLGLIVTIINALPGVQILPQYFHPITGFISLILLLKGNRMLRPARIASKE